MGHVVLGIQDHGTVVMTVMADDERGGGAAGARAPGR
jgi:hypothetical protein